MQPLPDAVDAGGLPLNTVRASNNIDTKSVLGDMKGRVHAMAQLHEWLYRSGTLASIDLGSYLGRLATQVFQTQGVNGGLVRLNLDMGSVQVGMDQATVGGLLLNELITNCIKHGFPEGRSGEVSVTLQPAALGQESDAKWCLSVSDTGIGLSADFEESRKTSLGMQLVGDLTIQLGGTLAIDSMPDKGVKFSVVFTALEPAPLVMPA